VPDFFLLQLVENSLAAARCVDSVGFFFPLIVYLKFVERVDDKITLSFTTTIFPFNWEVGLSSLKKRVKYKKLQYFHPGAGPSDEVMVRKVLPTSNQGNVQVEMLSLLTTPGVSHLFQWPLLQG